MPLHDWTKADDGLFHDFHITWLTRLVDALNDGLLPTGYFAMVAQHSGVYIPDVVTYASGNLPPRTGGIGATATAPHTEREVVLRARRARRRQRRVVIRTVRRVVAVIEIVSRSNKDRAKAVRQFAEKVADMVLGGIHVAVVDLLPPGRFEPGGIHPPICTQLSAGIGAGPPSERPLTFAGYRAGDCIPELCSTRAADSGNPAVLARRHSRRPATGTDIYDELRSPAGRVESRPGIARVVSHFRAN
jgi:hypothetical protein